MIHFLQTQPQLRVVGGKDRDLQRWAQEFKARVERQKPVPRLPPPPDEDE